MTKNSSDDDVAQKAVIQNIRQKQFGLGVKVDATAQAIIEAQNQRTGRSLLRLSEQLYSNDTHFVLELLQNAGTLLCFLFFFLLRGRFHFCRTAELTSGMIIRLRVGHISS